MDDHLAAAGTPVALDARGLGTVFLLSGGVLRAGTPVGEGESYRVWSYAPDPAPRELCRAPARYPFAASRFLEVDGREFPAFGLPASERASSTHCFDDPSYAAVRAASPDVRRGRARDAGERRRRTRPCSPSSRGSGRRGGFTYDESPPRGSRAPPLVAFVTRTKAGYCQHFAGAMAAMLRMLGIPARVAVGFTSGDAGGRNVGRDRPRRPCLGGGVVRGHRLDPVRSDARSRHVRRRVLVRVGLRGTPSHALRRGELEPNRRHAARRVSPTSVTWADDVPLRAAQAPSLVGVGLVLGRAVGRAARSWQGTRAARSLPLARSAPARDARAGASSRTSFATRASRFRRTRRSPRCSGPCTTSSGSTAGRSPRGRAGPLRPADGGRAGRGRRRDGRCVASSAPRGGSSRSGRASAGSCPFARCARERVSETYDLFQLGRSHLRSGTACSGDGLAREGEARRADVAFDPRGARDRVLPHRALGGGRGRVSRPRRARSVRRVRALRARPRARQPGPAQGGDAAHQARPCAASADARDGDKLE